MNKKLRLMVTTKCHNNCPMRCNKQFDFDSLPVVDRWDYDEIMITGGEPLSYLKKVRYLVRLIESIKEIQKAQGIPISKFYVYTATRHANLILKILRFVDGIVYTPHNLKELRVLGDVTRAFTHSPESKSLRINLFPDMLEQFEDFYPPRIQKTIAYYWEGKKIDWKEDCPIPEGEDFRRISILY